MKKTGNIAAMDRLGQDRSVSRILQTKVAEVAGYILWRENVYRYAWVGRVQMLAAKLMEVSKSMRREQVLHNLALSLALAGETGLLFIALVPQSVWASHGWPNGPIPQVTYPLVAALFYLFPAIIGGLCSRWQIAIVLATLPAWLDLGLFAVVAAGRFGPFYLAEESHAAGTASTLELFAALGALGWLTRVGLQTTLSRIQIRRGKLHRLLQLDTDDPCDCSGGNSAEG
jgi:hypothetical protein